MNDRYLPSSISLPPLPSGYKEIFPWMRSLYQALMNNHRDITDRVEGLILRGTLASRPDPKGLRRFYYSTDTSQLFIDVGTWEEI